MKKLHGFKVCGLLFAAAMASACYLDIDVDDQHRLPGNSHIVSEQRFTGSSFNGIALDGKGTVRIYPSEDYKVVVTTDSNLQDLVEIYVNNNYVHIDKADRWAFDPTVLTIDVYMPEVTGVKLNGIGSIIITNGSGSGLEMVLNGVGNIDARNYTIANGSVKLSGTGNIKTWVTGTLTGRHSGAGDILYWGSPRVDISKSGIGKIEPQW